MQYLFRDFNTNLFQERVTADNNYVNLDTDGVDMFIWATVKEAVDQQQGLDSMFSDGPNAENRYQDALAKYRAKYRSEVQKPGSDYYKVPAAGYRKWIGRGSRTP